MNKTENLTPEQAVEILNGKGDHISTLKRVQANRMGAEAIERCMIAKKPEDDYSNSIFIVAVCPTCGETLEEIKLLDYGNHCPNCGQKIDWRGVE